MIHPSLQEIFPLVLALLRLLSLPIFLSWKEHFSRTHIGIAPWISAFEATFPSWRHRIAMGIVGMVGLHRSIGSGILTLRLRSGTVLLLLLVNIVLLNLLLILHGTRAGVAACLRSSVLPLLIKHGLAVQLLSKSSIHQLIEVSEGNDV
jgi:hypothetical protein